MNTDATDLSRLHDIVTPPPAPLWPPAPGMLILLIVLAAALVAFLIRAFIHWQRNRYRREAIHELTKTADPAQIATLLKRAALTAYPREQVASLTGPAWHAFLDRTANTTAFTANTGSLLDQAIYESATLTETQTTQLTAAARHWIKHHKPQLA